MPKQRSIIEAKEHHFIEPRNIVLSGDPKTDRAVLRLERKRIRTEKEERTLLAAVELTKNVVDGGFRLAGTAVQGIGRAHGDAFGKWLGNPDPITWAAGGVAGLAYISWIALVASKIKIRDKTLADYLELNVLMNLIPTTTGKLAKEIQDAVINWIGGGRPGLPAKPDNAAPHDFAIFPGDQAPTPTYGYCVYFTIPNPFDLNRPLPMSFCFKTQRERAAYIQANQGKITVTRTDPPAIMNGGIEIIPDLYPGGAGPPLPPGR